MRSYDFMTRNDAIDHQFAYGQWISDHVAKGYAPYLMSFMFRGLSGSRTTKADRMLNEIEAFYGHVATRFARRPNAEAERHKLPRMLAAPDLPVAKHAKSSLRDATVNDGLHCHAMLLTPPISRFSGRFDLWVLAHEEKLIHGTRIERVYIEPVRTDPEYVTQYALKALGIRVSFDTLRILPRERGNARPNPTDRGYDEASQRVQGASMMRTGWKPF